MAILGDATSYTIGAKVGPKIFNRPKSRIFKPEHIAAAHAFYEKHGGKAIVIARSCAGAYVRTVIAGVRHALSQVRDLHVVGGIGWVSSMTLSGFFLGRIFPKLGSHVEKVIIGIVILSVLPMVFEYFKARSRGKAEAVDRSL